MKRSVRKGITAGVVLVLVAVVGFSVVKRISKPKEELVVAENPIVTTVNPQKNTIINETSLIGKIEPSDTYYVIPKAAGEISEIYAQNGDTVAKDQPICRIDNSKQVDAAKIALDSAQVQYNTAQSSLNRMTPLYEAGDVSAQEYEQIKAQVDAAALQVQSAQLNYDTQTEYSIVVAPAAGTIENSTMTQNAMVSQSSQLCMLTGDGAKKISFSVTDRMRSQLHLQDQVRIEKQGVTYDGTITEIGNVSDEQSGMFRVEAAITSGENLANGTSTKVVIVTDRADQVLSVPVDCIYYENGNSYVYTYLDGAVHQQMVETGLDDDTNIEIKSGLEEQSQVVASWTKELYENAPVQLLEDYAEETNEEQ